jgi:predicted N-acetyltransferase YhbS
MLVVRPETPADFGEIAAVVEAAFGKTNEVAIIQAIRDSDGYVPELALVAEDEGRVVGHTMLSRVGLEGGNRRLLQLAPMAVVPAGPAIVPGPGTGTMPRRAMRGASEPKAARRNLSLCPAN